MSKILITGATGFIGENLTKKLRDHYQIAVISRRSIETDLCLISTAELHKVVEFNPDIVIHLATCFRSKHSSNDLNQLLEANVEFGSKILQELAQCKTKLFINATTYATSTDGKTYAPQNLYSATKKAFEDILKFYQLDLGFDVVNLTLYDTYGPGDSRPKLINLLIDAAINNKPLKMSPGEQEICYNYIDDVVDAFLHTITLHQAGKCKGWNNYCIKSKEVINLKELVKRIETITNTEIKVDFGGYPYRPREIMKVTPRFPLLESWESKTSLKKGIREILNTGNQNE